MFLSTLKIQNICQLIVITLSTLTLIACKTEEASAPPPSESSVTTPQKPSKPTPTTFDTIEWTDLLPEADLAALENPPDYLDDIVDGSEADQLKSQLKASNSFADDRYQQALISKNVRPEFNNRNIRIAGFIVPLEFNELQTITTFFLVPFFGACIHVPPPPPNQIIYVEYEPGFRLDVLYDPFWVSGTVYTSLVENGIASAAYTIVASSIEPYTEY